MSGFLILIQGDETRWEEMTADERARIDTAHAAFRDRAGEAVIASGELQPSQTATTLRRGPDGEPVPVDGPFTEAKEVVGGFYVLDVPDRDVALELAALLEEPRHDHSGVQVQPLVDHGPLRRTAG